MRFESYLPLPIVPAFDQRSRLGLSVAPPFGLGVPHEPRRLPGLLCLLPGGQRVSRPPQSRAVVPGWA